MSYAKPATYARKSIDRVIVQGNNAEIVKLFEEIIGSANAEFTEDNYFTLISFLQECMLKAAMNEMNKMFPNAYVGEDKVDDIGKTMFNIIEGEVNLARSKFENS